MNPNTKPWKTFTRSIDIVIWNCDRLNIHFIQLECVLFDVKVDTLTYFCLGSIFIIMWIIRYNLDLYHIQMAESIGLRDTYE